MFTAQALPIRFVHAAARLPHLGSSAANSVTMNHPATSVMTDFVERLPVTVDADESIDEALNMMIRDGVRFMFVLRNGIELVGGISSYDIQGEKPIQFLHSIGCDHRQCRHTDVRVDDIMDPVARWEVLRYTDVIQASVQSIVSAFERTGRTHLVVVDGRSTGDTDQVRGIFSVTQLAARLGRPIQALPTARTFAQIESALDDHRTTM